MKRGEWKRSRTCANVLKVKLKIVLISNLKPVKWRFSHFTTESSAISPFYRYKIERPYSPIRLTVNEHNLSVRINLNFFVLFLFHCQISINEPKKKEKKAYAMKPFGCGCHLPPFSDIVSIAYKFQVVRFVTFT